MARSITELLELVSELSTSQKLGLVAQVINDLEGPEDEAWAAAWQSELDRRMADPNEQTGASWEEVRERALSTLLES